MAEIQPSKNICKPLFNSNPVSSNVFCADPTGVEYEGRLYIYGTSDHQQYEVVGKNGKNIYEHIKSLVCFSTEDMVNWTYHGEINVKKIAPINMMTFSYNISSVSIYHRYQPELL